MKRLLLFAVHCINTIRIVRIMDRHFNRKMKRYLQRLLLDNRILFRCAWFARRAGGLMIGAKIEFPLLVTGIEDYENGEGYWWYQTAAVFLLFCSVTVTLAQRVIPHSPTQLFQEVS